MPVRAAVFDLDETLIEDQAWAEDALVEACALVTPADGAGPRRAAAEVRMQAIQAWGRGPDPDRCESLGITWWEGLVSESPGPGVDGGQLAAWLPRYRLQAWSAGLAAAGVKVEPEVAVRAAAEFRRLRTERFRIDPEAVPLLDWLRAGERVRLGLVTNGPADLQRGKLQRTGLGRLFDAIVVSGEVGRGKPDPYLFELVLDRLGVPAGESVMIGDSLARDVAGGAAAGLATIWLPGPGRGATPEAGPGPRPDFTAHGLAEARSILERLL